MLLSCAFVEIGVPDERELSEELAVTDGLGSAVGFADDAGSVDDAGAVDEVGSADDSGVADEEGSAEDSGVLDVAGSDESVETTAVVVDVDAVDNISGRSTVTAAVVNAVVLPDASTLAVTATTRSASEFVLIMSDTAAVPCRLSRRSRSSALRTERLWISRCTSSTCCGEGRA